MERNNPPRWFHHGWEFVVAPRGFIHLGRRDPDGDLVTACSFYITSKWKWYDWRYELPAIRMCKECDEWRAMLYRRFAPLPETEGYV